MELIKVEEFTSVIHVLEHKLNEPITALHE